MTDMGSQYLRHRFTQGGWDWVDRLMETLMPAPYAAAELLIATGDPPAAWDRADRLGDEVANQYWNRVKIFGYDLKIEHVTEAVQRLQAVSRHDSALALLSRYIPQSSGSGLAELVADALETAKGHSFGERPETRQYDFERLLQLLSDHTDTLGRDRVALIEWYYLPTLGFDPDPRTLHIVLAEDPGFFVRIVKLIYRPATPPAAEPSEPSEHETSVADNAEKLLDSWHGGPGLNTDGRIDVHLLGEWIRQARSGLAEADRRDVGDYLIGKALSSSPAEPDGSWPSQPVRDLIEALENDTIERGFEHGVYNSRGVVSRSTDDAGAQERQLADTYKTLVTRYSAEWPRVAAIFSRLARGLKREANDHDKTTERLRRGLDH